MTTRRLALFLLFFLTLSACAWQRIPPVPQYAGGGPIPIKVGVIPAEDPGTMSYAPYIVKEWKDIPLFEAVIYPYREDDLVDVVLLLSVAGGWKGFSDVGYVIGFTFGLAGTVLGPSLTGDHAAVAAFMRGRDELAKYSVQAKTEVEWGMMADTNEVAQKATTIQIKQLAYELAKKIEADRGTLLSKLGK